MTCLRIPATLITATALALGSTALATGAIAATPASVTGPVTSIAPTMPAGGVFGAGSAWTLDVRSAPLNANSAAMVKNVADQTASQYGGVAAFNAYDYSTSVYTVPAGQKKVDVAWNNCQGKSWTPEGLLGDGGQFSQVPIPDNAVAAGAATAN